jgi:hypothetical protein
MKSAREAKEFLVSEVVLEAQRENIDLSEVERKMLYFSETCWTLSDMLAVYDNFDAEYDQGKYERKIAKLIRAAYKHACSGERQTYDKWWASMHLLSREDHYLVVMIRLAGLRPRHDQLKLFVTALAIVALFLSGLLLSIKYDIHLPKFARRLTLHASPGEYVWAFTLCVFVVYQLLRFVVGAKRTDDLTSKALRKFARVANRAK